MLGINLTWRARQTVRTQLVPASLLALGIVPVVAGFVRLARLLTGQASADDARFFERPLPITLHILTLSIVRGVMSLLRHEYHAHGAWMLRGYALGMGPATQVLSHFRGSSSLAAGPASAAAPS